MKTEKETAVQMRKVEDTFCHKSDDDLYRKKEVRGECDSQFSWDPSPGTDKRWKRTITSGRLNRLVRQAQKKPFVPSGLIKMEHGNQ
jgi:hypothetical protein